MVAKTFIYYQGFLKRFRGQIRVTTIEIGCLESEKSGPYRSIQGT